MIKTKLLFVLLCLVTGFANQKAKSEIIIGFSLDGGATFVNETVAGAGESVNVGVYAIDSGNQLATFGLQNVGTLASYNIDFGQATDTKVSLNFDDTGSSFDNFAGELNLQGLTLMPGDNAGSVIEIGMFKFDVSDNGSTVFQFGDFDPVESTTNFTLGDDEFTDLDPIIFGDDRTKTYSFTISGIPEPSTACIFTLAMGLVFCRRRRL